MVQHADIDHTGLTGVGGGTPDPHATSHESGGSDEIAPVSLRVTTVFRREDGEWRIVHRHADPITSPRSLESLLQQQAG